MRRARCSGWVPRWCRAPRHQRRGGVEAARHQVPHDPGDLVVAEGPAVDHRGHQGGGHVVGRVGPAEGGEAGQLGPHVVAAGHCAAEPCVGGLVRRGGVEEVGVVFPVRRLHAHQLEGQDRRDRCGVVEHQVRGASLDDLVEEPGRDRLHPRPFALDDPGCHVGVEHPAQIGVLGAVDLRHPHAGHVRRPGYAADAVVGDPVVGVGLVLVGERLVVAGHGRHRLVVGDHPEPAVMLVEQNRAALPHLGVAAVAVGNEGRGLMVDIDGAVGQVLHRPRRSRSAAERTPAGSRGWARRTLATKEAERVGHSSRGPSRGAKRGPPWPERPMSASEQERKITIPDREVLHLPRCL